MKYAMKIQLSDLISQNSTFFFANNWNPFWYFLSKQKHSMPFHLPHSRPIPLSFKWENQEDNVSMHFLTVNKQKAKCPHQSYHGLFRMETVVGIKMYASSTLHLSWGRAVSPIPPPLPFLMPWRMLCGFLLCFHTWPQSSPSSLDVIPDPTPSTVLSFPYTVWGRSYGLAADIPVCLRLEHFHKAVLALVNHLVTSHMKSDLCMWHWCGHPYRSSPVFLRNACPGVCPGKSWLLSPHWQMVQEDKCLPARDVLGLSQIMTKHEPR